MTNLEASSLRLALPKVDLVLDPHRMEDAYSMTVNLQIHRGLLRYTPEGDVLPDLAEKWRVSPDQKRYIFKLRDATFSDGSPVEAAHVVHSFARLFNFGSTIGADLDYIKGIQKFKTSHDVNDLGVRAISTKEVEFELDNPSALFTKQLAAADCAVVRVKDFKDNVTFDSKTPTSGTYKITGEAPLKITKWRKDPLDSKLPPEEIEFIQTDESPVKLALKNNIDSIDHDPVTSSEESLLRAQGWQRSVTELVDERFVILNPDKLDLALRQYLYSSVDPEKLTQALPGSAMKPAYGIIPNGVPGALSHEDIAHLRQKSAAKGAVKIQFPNSNKVSETIANHLKKTWQSKTLMVELVPLPPREFLDLMFQSKGDVLIGSKGLDYFDGFSVLSYFRGHYPGNYFHVKDRVIDQLLNAAVQDHNFETRIQKYRELQLKILGHYTTIPLMFGSMASGLWSKRTSFVPPHPGGIHTLPFESIEMGESKSK